MRYIDGLSLRVKLVCIEIEELNEKLTRWLIALVLSLNVTTLLQVLELLTSHKLDILSINDVHDISLDSILIVMEMKFHHLVHNYLLFVVFLSDGLKIRQNPLYLEERNQHQNQAVIVQSLMDHRRYAFVPSLEDECHLLKPDINLRVRIDEYWVGYLRGLIYHQIDIAKLLIVSKSKDPPRVVESWHIHLEAVSIWERLILFDCVLNVLQNFPVIDPEVVDDEREVKVWLILVVKAIYGAAIL